MHQETTVAIPTITTSPSATPPSTPPTPPASILQTELALDPAAWLEHARTAGEILWRIDSQSSLVAVTVRRGGALARLGHDHVVAVRTLEGWFHPGSTITSSTSGTPGKLASDGGQPARAALRFRLDGMTVDETALRAEAGLGSTPTVDAVAGTRHNMLARVLDAEQYPLVHVQVQGRPGAPLHTMITLHGVTRSYTVPAEVSINPERVTAKGTLLLNQTDFGLTPFSVLGGAIAVQDQMELRFEISARH